MLVVIGTTTLDIFMTGLDDLPTPSGDEFTPESISFTGDPPTMTLGGNGANSAYVAAGLGANTVLCSVVADDAAGRMLSDWLEARGVGLEGLRRDGSATSMTIVATDRDRARLSFHHPGSGRTYTPDHLPVGLIEAADNLLLSGYHLLSGMRGDAGARLLERAQAAGTTTALDVGPIVPPPATEAEWTAVLPQTDYLIGNEYELLTCTGTASLDDAASALLEVGSGTIIAKLGAAGAAGFSASGRVDAPGFAVDVLSTVGAGDSFNAGVLVSLSNGQNLGAALRFGNAVAALVISSGRGVLDGPNRSDVASILGAS
jgi:ribokinase